MCVAGDDFPVSIDAVRKKSEGQISAGAGEMMDFEPLDLFHEIDFIRQQRRNGNQRPKRFRDTLS